MNTSFAAAIREVFAAPLGDSKKPRADLKAEAPLKLAYGLLPTGLTYGQLNALALAVREVAKLETTAPTSPLSKPQEKAWKSLQGEKALPAPFRELLAAAARQVRTRFDLHLLYGLLVAAMEKLATIARVSELVVQEAAKPVKVERPRGKLRG
jgi:hypothetical protein